MAATPPTPSMSVPSMPGYGFSDHPTQRGMHVFKVADLWAKLMTEGLGISAGAQGGDWGPALPPIWGLPIPATDRHPCHLDDSADAVSWPRFQSPVGGRKTYLEQREAWLQAEGGYSHIQGMKPQTLSYGLNDSPGLAAWIVEKYRTWSDCHGEVESRFTKDELLTTITLYWVTQTINSSTRLYYETLRQPWTLQQGERIVVPSAMAAFPKEISRPPREGERSFNVQRWTEMPRGGHFAALEEPELLA